MNPLLIYPRLKSVIILALLLLLGCADRKHDNPLDPQNPTTNGRLTGVSIISLDDQVSLSWNAIDIDNYRGTRVFRRSSLSGDFEEVAFVEGLAASYDDRDQRLSFDGGITYTYRLQAVTDDFESPVSQEVFITPGPSRVWIGQFGGPIVARLTHDASHLLLEVPPRPVAGDLSTNYDLAPIFTLDQFNFIFSTDIAMKRHKKGIWISDAGSDAVFNIDEEGKLIGVLAGFNTPLGLSYDPQTEFLWVWQDRLNSPGLDSTEVVVLDSTGTVFGVAGPFGRYVSMDVDTSSGIAWIADRFSGRIRLLEPQNLLFATFEGLVEEPVDIKISYTDESFWFADIERVHRYFIRNDFLEIYDEGFDFAYRLAIDQRTGDCWVIDRGFGSGTAQIVKITASGEIAFRLSGFSFPEALTVDQFDGSCLVADSGNSRVVKLSANGTIIGEWRSQGVPVLIGVTSP